MIVASGVDTAPGPVFVLVGESERAVTELVERDLERARRERRGRNRAAATAIDAGVDEQQDRVPLRYLGVHRRDDVGGIRQQQSPDARVAERTVEERRGGRAAPAAGGRVVGAAVGRPHVHAIHVDRGRQRRKQQPAGIAERRRREQRRDDVLRVGGKLRQFGLAIAITDDDEVPAIGWRSMVDDQTGPDNRTISQSH